MKNTKPSMPYNLGKVEFFNFFQEILELYILGHTRAFIFRKLSDESKLTMSYNTFCYHMRKYEQKKEGAKPQEKKIEVEKRELRVPKTVTVGDSKFKSPDHYKDVKLT